MYGQGPCSIVSHVLLYVIQLPRWSSVTSKSQQTTESLEHPVLDVLSAMNREGQISCWAIVCSMKQSIKMNEKICKAFIVP